MATKNVYFFSVVIRDTVRNREVHYRSYKAHFDAVFNVNSRNGAIRLTREDQDPTIMLDVISNDDEYLFARLSCKRPNNSMLRRNYVDYTFEDVVPEDEQDEKGVELFTYCILGYSHGILSVVNSKGAPNEKALARVFQMYNNRYSLETTNIPNQDLLNELLNGEAPEINRIEVDMPMPSAQVMQQLFGFNENQVFNALNANGMNIVFEIKPMIRAGALLYGDNHIRNIINALRGRRQRYNNVTLSGKPKPSARQRQYDINEQYFNYPIMISDYHQVDGRKVEYSKEYIQQRYLEQMMSIYDDYKDVILAVSNRP